MRDFTVITFSLNTFSAYELAFMDDVKYICCAGPDLFCPVRSVRVDRAGFGHVLVGRIPP